MAYHFLFDNFSRYTKILRGDGYTSGDPRCVLKRMSQLFEMYLQDLGTDKILESECRSEVESVCAAILSSFSLFQNGLQSDSFTMFYENVFNKMLSGTLILDPQKQPSLYRMRAASHGEMFSKEDMFHIRYSMTHIVKTARYSTIGYPSLYLGNSVYICWEELRRTDFESANIACFAITKECRLLDLSLMTTTDNKYDAIRFPLCLACSLVTLHPEGDYKPEYVIPQLLMQSILTYNNRYKETIIDGIRYSSRAMLSDVHHYNPFGSKEKKLFINYVFPAVRSDESDEDISSHLMSLFKYTEAHTFEEYDNLFHYQTNTKDSMRFGKRYAISKFSRMEQYLDANIPAEAYGKLNKKKKDISINN